MAEDANERYKYLVEQGTEEVAVALDLPTQLSYDSDNPLCEGEVGRIGVAIDTLADVIGLSCLSGGHNVHFAKVIALLREKGADDILVIGRGIMPPEDIASLEEKGVKGIFGPGTRNRDVADFIRQNVKR